jgi:hypothetical protein
MGQASPAIDKASEFELDSDEDGIAHAFEVPEHGQGTPRDNSDEL